MGARPRPSTRLWPRERELRDPPGHPRRRAGRPLRSLRRIGPKGPTPVTTSWVSSQPVALLLLAIRPPRTPRPREPPCTTAPTPKSQRRTNGPTRIRERATQQLPAPGDTFGSTGPTRTAQPRVLEALVAIADRAPAHVQLVVPVGAAGCIPTGLQIYSLGIDEKVQALGLNAQGQIYPHDTPRCGNPARLFLAEMGSVIAGHVHSRQFMLLRGEPVRVVEVNPVARRIYLPRLIARIHTRCWSSCSVGNVLTVWRLDRLGRSVSHLVNLVELLKHRPD